MRKGRPSSPASLPGGARRPARQRLFRGEGGAYSSPLLPGEEERTLPSSPSRIGGEIGRLVDIGANLTHKSFRHDLEQVLERARLEGVERIVVTGTDRQSAEGAIHLAEKYPGRLFATVGLHPHHARDSSPETRRALSEMAAHPAVKAAGETGLDFCRNYSSRAEQEGALAWQLEMAAERKLPLFLHARDADARMYEILKDARDSLGAAVVHCFTGERKALFRYLDLDLYIGITGWVCDERRGRHLHPLLSSIPPGRLMIETDAPYLVPRSLDPAHSPLAEARRNEPAALPHILAEIAMHTGRTPASLAESTRENAERFFALPPYSRE